MISASEFLKWLEVFNVDFGGGGGGGVTELQVQRSAFNFTVGTGSNDHFVAILNPPVTLLTDGLLITMSTPYTNLTVDPTLQVNALTPVPIVTTLGEALVVGDISAHVDYLFVYSLIDNNFQVINPSISIANAYLVQKNYYNYAPDIGVANAYVANFPVKPLAISEGLSVILQVDNTNTGASTLVLNGYPSAPIVGISGGALLAGEILGGSIAELIYSGNYNAFVLINSAIVAGTGTVGAGTINDLAWYAASGTTISSLATADNGLLVTSASGVPSIGNTVGADIIVNLQTIGQGGFSDPEGSNSAFGDGALANNSSGTENIAIGFASLIQNTSGFQNVSIGAGSSQANNGNLNTIIGNNAGSLLGTTISGNQNILFGANSGNGSGNPLGTNLNGGSNNTFIGYFATGSAETMNGAIALGTWAVADPSNGILAVDKGPGIAIGAASFPVGFRGDGTAFPAGNANYWRVKINDTYYNLPILPDGTSIEWPSTGTLATTSTASGIVNSGLVNELTYYAATGTTVSGLATADNGLLVTSASGVPSIGNTIGKDIVVSGITVGQGNYFDPLFTNVALGHTALFSNTSGTYNVALGFAALSGLIDGGTNVAVGTFAGLYQNSYSSTLIGHQAGYLLGQTGASSANTLIGGFVGNGGGNPSSVNIQEGNWNTWLGGSVCGTSHNISGTIGIGQWAAPDPSTVAYSPGIAIGSNEYPVGFLQNGTPLPGGNAGYWRMKINDTYFNIPILPDGTTIQWPSTGTLATTTSGEEWINVTTSPFQMIEGQFYIANYASGITVFILPITSTVGYPIGVKGGLANFGWKITEGTGQQIQVGNVFSTTSTGYVESLDPTDSLSLVCLATNTIWGNSAVQGTINIM